MDALTKFKGQLDSFPKGAGDLNIICSITYAEYKVYVTILNGLLMPQTIAKRGLDAAVTGLNTATYNTLINGLSKLNIAVKSILPQPFNSNMNMTFDVGRVGNMLTQTCADFLGSVPEALFNIFQDIEHGMMDLASMANGIFTLPQCLAQNIANSLLQLKDDAMKELFGSSLFNSMLSPFIMYENFLKANGVIDMIKKMEKIEVEHLLSHKCWAKL